MKKTILFAILLVFIFAVAGCGGKSSVEDGKCTAELTMSGGTGRAHIESPAHINIEEGKIELLLVWNSKNYDYMIVDGVKYQNETPGEASSFRVMLDSVSRLKEEIPVLGNTTAMSVPHEIEYTIKLGELKKYE